MENIVSDKKKLGLLPKILIILFLLILLIYCWMHFGEPKIITVKDFIIQDEKIPLSFDGFTIVHFSDIHFGRTTNEKELNKVVDKINEIDADIVLFSGDLFDPYITLSDENISYLQDTFKKINAKMKKYAVVGDYDTDHLDVYEQILKSSNFELLNGHNQSIYYKGNVPIYISGIASISKITPDYSNAFSKDGDYLQLFLSHEPGVINDIKNKADYVFSGHTLGGQIRIPFVGGIKKMPNSSIYEIGKYNVDKATLFVNNGIGTQDISLRLFNLPTIYCYRFVK